MNLEELLQEARSGNMVAQYDLAMHYGKLLKETEDEDALLQGEYVDPWGTEIKYERRGKKRPLLTSAGPDKEFGTEDDITNLDKKKN